MRKSNVVKKESEQLLEKYNETQELLKIAEEEENEKLKRVEEKIKKICEEEEVYCGLILDHDLLLNIIKFALESKTNVNIPFRIYHKE